VVTAAAFAVLSAAGLMGADAGRTSPLWLGGSYALLAVAELLLAPLGVALVTTLAPVGRAALAVGLWFAATAAGSLLGGALGLLWGRWPHHRYFALIAALALGAAALLWTRLRALEAVLACRARDGQPQTLAEGGMSGLPTTSSPWAPAPAASGAALWVASLSIALPAALVALPALSLPMRAISAIACGLTLLPSGSYLAARAIDTAALRRT
jgi:MFS family permease